MLDDLDKVCRLLRPYIDKLALQYQEGTREGLTAVQHERLGKAISSLEQAQRQILDACGFLDWPEKTAARG